MGEKIFVGPISKGLRNDVTPFNVDNDSFPFLLNAFQWRGRIKRKRGTSQLGRLTRYFNSLFSQFNPGTTTQVLNGSSIGNLLTGFASAGIQTNAQIVPGSLSITDATSGFIYTDPGQDGVLVTVPPNPGTINYATGQIFITGGAGHTIYGSFKYYPDLPVMGLEDLLLDPTDDTHTLAFDTTYVYNIDITSPYAIYAVNFYKNPASATYVDYVAKATWTPFHFNGASYQQFWSQNYENAFFITNGISRPFSASNISMQYKPITGVVIDAAGPPAKATLSIAMHGLDIGDFLFINEVDVAGGGITGINFQTGYVVATGVGTVQVEFPNATLGGAYTSGGIAQYLTNNSDASKDCLKWYDGLPINNASPPVFSTGRGWVNFCPPLSNGTVSIASQPAARYYLVGARMILSFKDRLLFIGPVIQTSAASSQIYLQDTVIYSQNGSPFYTASFAGAPSASTIYTSILTPPDPANTSTRKIADPRAFWVDQTGLGGWISSGFAADINTASANEDVIIMGFGNRQARFVYTGSDLFPFAFYTINSELGSNSTFSAINLDRGIISVGTRGVVISSQNETKRIDLDIPDQVFQIQLTDQGAPRISSVRDFINEWIYITYATADNGSQAGAYDFPSQTLQYNYREGSWALLNECYTTYGLFRKSTGFTWSTLPYKTWNSWNVPWDSGESTLLQPDVVGGNQQGFVMIKSIGTGEGDSIYIKSFSGADLKTVTSPDHCLNEGDFVVIYNCLGTIGSSINGKIFKVGVVSDANTFKIINDDVTLSGTYSGAGTIRRMYIPSIKTRQFPVKWGMSRKTRLGPQQYLFTKTDNGQITLQIYLSQDMSFPYNNQSDNDSLVYSTVLYTCPELSNLGLTPANINLQMVSSGSSQEQIWHRMNTSLVGDTVQIGFTLSDDQMFDDTFSNQFVEIELHAFILDVTSSQVLA